MKSSVSALPAAVPFEQTSLSIPMQKVGPFSMLFGDSATAELVDMSLATFETPLWPSVGRGAKVSREIGGLRATLISDNMTRSIAIKAKSAHDAHQIVKAWENDPKLSATAETTGRFVKLSDWHARILGRNIYLRLSYTTSEASGHNMVTKASDAVIDYLCKNYAVEYISISGNMCVDKKVSAVNNILGRGKSVIIEGVIPESICLPRLKTTPQAIHQLNVDKNYMGSLVAGSLFSANAHYANMLLAFYLAHGQDAANIVEGSQGVTTTEVITTDNGETALYFAVNLPNIIVGTIGNGKDIPAVQDNIDLIGCGINSPTSKDFTKSQRMAMLAAASVWAGELSLLAAQTNPGELMSTHVQFERGAK